MDWNNTKWDWDNLVSFTATTTTTASPPKKQLRFADYLFMEGDEQNKPGNNHDACSSADDSSARNNPPSSSAEQLIGLKLGKRTYFENTGSGGSSSSAAAKSGGPSSSSHRPSKATCRLVPRCVVEGCSLDLTTAKEYHRKHKVCEAHSKCSKVILGGLERRFCQQCSRFHSLSEFDDMKRSCRRRLMDHNARRRKPQPETAFSSSPFFSGGGGGGAGENLTTFLLPNSAASTFHPMWDNNPAKFGFINAGGTTSVKLAPWMFHSSSTAHMEAAALPIFDHGHGRALSLLSTDSWGAEPSQQQLPPIPPPAAATHYQQDGCSTVPSSCEHALGGGGGGEGLALSSSSGEFFLHRDAREEADIHDFRAQYVSDFYHNILN